MTAYQRKVSMSALIPRSPERTYSPELAAQMPPEQLERYEAVIDVVRAAITQ